MQCLNADIAHGLMGAKEMEKTVIWFLIWAGVGALLTGLAAQARGRSVALWALLGALFGFLALIAVLVMEPAEDEDRHAAADTNKPERLPPLRPAPSQDRVVIAPIRLDQVAATDFNRDVIGGAGRQDMLRTIVGARDLPLRLWADLKADPTNLQDRNAVRVSIEGKAIGFLDRDDSLALRQAGRATSEAVLAAVHPAVIFEGMDLDGKATGELGVRVMLRGL